MKFKPTGYPEDCLKNGVYFRSENDVTNHYLIEVCDGRYEGNALVKIYTTDIPSNHFDIEGLINGCEISFLESDTNWIAEIDLCGKYFFPKFNNDLQLYYDDEKYYGADYKSNSITSLFECINFAIEFGLKKANIIPY